MNLLEAVDKELEKVALSRGLLSAPSPRGGEEESQVDREARESEAQSVLPTRRCFRTETKSTLMCDLCGHSRPRVEVSRNICLDVSLGGQEKDVVALSELLSHHLKDEEVELRCEQPRCCGSHAKICYEISVLPPVLVMILKRFTMDFTRTGKVRKINARVRAPRTLQLGRGAIAKKYCMRGVVYHRGSTPFSGEKEENFPKNNPFRWKKNLPSACK